MMAKIAVAGVSHLRTTASMRDSLQPAPENAVALARSLAAGGREAAVLVTCRRTEVYLTGADGAERAARRALAELGGLALPPPSVYSHDGEEAARHLFRVAAGLESIVPGDTHVTAQVRQAHQLARDAGTTGPLLDRLFEGASAASKRIRTRTSISSGATSTPAAAIAMAARIAGPLASHRLLIVGAGKIAQVAAVHSWSRGCRDITVANRTAGRGEKLATRVGGRAVGLDQLCTELATVDVVLSATASRRFVLTEDHLGSARPIVIFDMAAPPDVHPAFVSICRLVDLDGLSPCLPASGADRRADLERAAIIADEEAAHYESWRAPGLSFRPLLLCATGLTKFVAACWTGTRLSSPGSDRPSASWSRLALASWSASFCTIQPSSCAKPPSAAQPQQRHLRHLAPAHRGRVTMTT